MDSVRQFTADDGHRLDAYCAEPSVPRRGSVIVLQEAFGVNAHIRSVCNDYATHGYYAVAPALYDRQQRHAAFGYDEEGLQQARVLRRGLDYAAALRDIEAVARELRGHGPVCVVGYCVGGSAAWLAASRLRIDAAACYYPSDLGEQLDERPLCPVVVHFAERDRFIPAAVVEAFRRRYPQVPAFIYAAEHGFNCSNRAQGYDAASASLARERTSALFARAIASAPG